MDELLKILDLIGVAVFAFSGAMAAAGKKLDLFGVVVIAGVTALGGGTLRDLVLDADAVFWVQMPVYIYVVTAAAAVFAMLRHWLVVPMKLLAVADALGLGLFAVIGAQKTLAVGHGATVAIVMGVITSAAGGMVRDLLTGRQPMILRSELYATASLAGAIVYVACNKYIWAAPLAAAITFMLRIAAIKWKLQLPIISYEKK